MARKAKGRKPKPDLPSREAILEFISRHPGKAGKREIAREFGIDGADRMTLKGMLREMADEGLVERRRKRLARPGDLPSVAVLAIQGIDDLGEPIGVPVEWDESWGAPPRIVIATEGKGREARGKAPGLSDRVLARLTPDDENGGYTARIIKLL